MCGLVASVSVLDDIDPAEQQRMLKLAEHRGPDGTGLVVMSSSTPSNERQTPTVSGWAVLGHVRLAIIDKSDSSAQPMTSICGRYSITYNGEIYNFKEIRRELEEAGVFFRTNGDTEVLFAAVVKWGESALNRLRGMFSFVFVDKKERYALAVRDRYGIKPLYFWHDGKHIHFASEIKQFTAHSRWKGSIERRNALLFLMFGVTDVDERTLFDGVFHVRPGSLIRIELDRTMKIDHRVWWIPSRETFRGSYDSAVHEYRDRFRQTLELHLRSDVPVASCLSGGLDSSSIVGCIAKWFPRDSQELKLFTARSQNRSLDESGYARSMCEWVGGLGFEVEPRVEGLWDNLDRIVWHQDEPFGSTSIFAQWLVFNRAHIEGVKVVLDGQGADEQLGGYDPFISLAILERLELGQLMEGIAEFKRFSHYGRVSGNSLAIAAATRYLPYRTTRGIGKRLGFASQNAGDWLNSDLISQMNIKDPFRPVTARRHSFQETTWDMVDRLNLPRLLRFEDRSSMAFGVEARVPYVDHELMEFALTLPSTYLIRDGKTKSVLRETGRFALPNEIVDRTDKIGFETDEKCWLEESRAEVLRGFDEVIPQVSALFTRHTRDVICEQLSSRKFSSIPWRITSFLRWAKVFKMEV